MKTNGWLYGEGVEVPPIPKGIAQERIDLLKINLEKQVNLNFMERETQQINDILKAIKYWEKLRDGNNL